jgi:NTP pyrophosphatase (non-canonical NTP hydrolase)
MDLNDYQRSALATAIYPNRGSFYGLMYTALKLNGEAGEVAEKVGKIYRDAKSEVSPDKVADLVKELGDVLWYVAAAANELDCSLEVIAVANLHKLQARKERNVLSGSGDNR